jgi:hypothetical protein
MDDLKRVVTEHKDFGLKISSDKCIAKEVRRQWAWRR